MSPPANTPSKLGQPPGSTFGSRLVAIVVGTTLVCGLAALLLWQMIFVRIPPGHVGVLYSLLFGGTVTEMVYPEGLAVKLPWNRMYIFETRLQAVPLHMTVLSAEGMTVGIQAIILARVRRQEAANLLIEIGPDYIERVIKPISTFAVREFAAQFNSHELYSIDSAKFRAAVMEYLKSPRYLPQSRFFEFEELAVQEIKIPEPVLSSIHQKLGAEQQASAYEFRLAAQRMEAERLRIEALGLRNFYSIVQSSLTDKLLTWRGIEATVQIARSPNTKIVIVGGNKDQLPLILGSDIARQASPAGEPVSPVPGDTSPLPDWQQIPPLFPDPLGNIQRMPQTAPRGNLGAGRDEKGLHGPSRPPSAGNQPNAQPQPDAIAKPEPPVTR
jgi:regulator of protease activity HflC (stomatin/prohibitin superfamily)